MKTPDDVDDAWTNGELRAPVGPWRPLKPAQAEWLALCLAKAMAKPRFNLHD